MKYTQKTCDLPAPKGFLFSVGFSGGPGTPSLPKLGPQTAEDNDGHEPELTSVCQQTRDDLDSYCEVDPDPSSMGFGWKKVKDSFGLEKPILYF